MKLAQTISTMAEAVEYLTVHCGVKPNWAQAMVTEFYHFENDTLLQRPDHDGEINTVMQSELEVFGMYRDWLTYDPTETPEGITFDGELVYDLNGFYL